MDPLSTISLNGSTGFVADSACTPELQQCLPISIDSDDDSAQLTPTDITTAAQSSPHTETFSNARMHTDEGARKIHYIDTPQQTPPYPTLLSATLGEQVASIGSSSEAASKTFPGTLALSTSPPPPSTLSEAPTAESASVVNPKSNTNDPLPSNATPNAPSSTSSTPVSTPGTVPQTYARKRGRPRKHPLPDPNNPPPPKAKRKLSADGPSASAKKKASAAAAARSAASSAGSLLSVPDLGRLIPQRCTSENAQTFIQNNLRLFADLFVALQKQASSDNSGADDTGIQHPDFDDTAASSHRQDNAEAPVTVDNNGLIPSISMDLNPSGAAQIAALSGTGDVATIRPSTNPTTADGKAPGPSNAIRDEIRKRLTDVTKGREAIHAEMLQMRVDASFFENAQKTVDERISILRERIAKHTALLQREREATRKAREATRKAKKDRKAREKGLRESEREERRLAQTFAQLEREIAAEEEERRRLAEVESSDEEHEQDGETAGQDQHGFGSHLQKQLADQLDGLDPSILGTSPSEAASLSTIATPAVSIGTPAPDRAISFSDEELAKVLGISTSELTGFSQTLELTSQPSSQPIGSTGADSSSLTAPSVFGPLLPANQPGDQLGMEGSSNAADSFDVAAFLEMAASFGAVAPMLPTSTQQDEGSSTNT